MRFKGSFICADSKSVDLAIAHEELSEFFVVSTLSTEVLLKAVLDPCILLCNWYIELSLQ